jgi:hypothetical protein
LKYYGIEIFGLQLANMSKSYQTARLTTGIVTAIVTCRSFRIFYSFVEALKVVAGTMATTR